MKEKLKLMMENVLTSKRKMIIMIKVTQQVKSVTNIDLLCGCLILSLLLSSQWQATVTTTA